MAKNLKLSVEEEDYLDKVVVIAKKDKNTVKNIFKSMLKAITLAIYTDTKEIYIPYIAKLKIDYKEKLTDKGVDVQVTLKAEALDCLVEEIRAICRKEASPTEKELEQHIYDIFCNIVDKK